MATKKLSQVEVKEGALTKLGWPSATTIVGKVRGGSVPYATAVQRLNYLANITADQKTKMRAKAIMVRLKDEFGKDKGG
jgi:hypothetical protein